MGEDSMSEKDKVKFVMALDVGTTTIRSMVYDKKGKVVGTAARPVKYVQVNVKGIFLLTNILLGRQQEGD